MATSLFHTLGDVQIPRALVWVDEFNYSAVARAVEPSITGSLIVDIATLSAGQPITLQGVDTHGWVRRTGLLPLYALVQQPLEEIPLTLADGRTFFVMFAPDSPINAEAISRAELPTSNLPYVVTVRLIVVRKT